MGPTKETQLAITEEENKTTENRAPPLQQRPDQNFLASLYDEKNIGQKSLFELKEGYLGLKRQFTHSLQKN